MEYRISDKLKNLKPSAIREIFKSLSDKTIISFAAGNPSPLSFPVEKMHFVADEIFKNEASVAFHKALGFKEEGVSRESAYFDGKYHDVVYMGMIDRDFFDMYK